MAPDFGVLGEISLDDLKTNIDTFDKRSKFMLEEGSRFRGYKNPSARPSIGYKVVDYITVYEQTPPGQLAFLSGGIPIFMADMHLIFERFNAEHYVNDLGVKEFWIWQGGVDRSFPSFQEELHRFENFRSLFESNMSSPLTGDISNGPRDNDDLPLYNSTYTVYGYNFRRTQAEALHNHGHQLEALLSHVNRLQDGDDALFWQRFVGRDEQGNFITGRCGWTHMPPNTTIHYDYENPTLVLSDCEDWTPDNTGVEHLVNVDTWGKLVYAWPDGATDFDLRVQSQWYIYWMQNMPGFGNTIPHGDRVMTNWWAFTGDWDASISADLGLHALPVTALPSPRNLRARVIRQLVLLQWQSTNDATNFHVFRRLDSEIDFSEIAQTIQPVFSDTLPRHAASAEYVVVAENTFGQSTPSVSITVSVRPSIVVGLPPEAPQNLSARVMRGLVLLQWQGTTNTTLFRILRRLDIELDFTEAGQATQLLFNDRLPQGTVTADYIIVAENQFGISPESNSVTVRP
jgi:hypothetical protein